MAKKEVKRIGKVVWVKGTIEECKCSYSCSDKEVIENHSFVEVYLRKRDAISGRKVVLEDLCMAGFINSTSIKLKNKEVKKVAMVELK